MTTRLAAGPDSTIWVGAAEPTVALHHRPAGCRIGRPGEGRAPRSPVGEYEILQVDLEAEPEWSKAAYRRRRDSHRAQPAPLAGTPRRDSLSGRPGDRIVGGLRPSEYLAMPWRHLSI